MKIFEKLPAMGSTCR